MLVVEHSRQVCYLAASTIPLPDSVQFTLHAHRLRPATTDEPLALPHGALVGLVFNREEFPQVQQALTDGGVKALRPHLARKGDRGADLRYWTHSTNLAAKFLTWANLHDDLLSGLSDHASVLLDEFKLTTQWTMG